MNAGLTSVSAPDHHALQFGVMFAGYVRDEPGLSIIYPPAFPVLTVGDKIEKYEPIFLVVVHLLHWLPGEFENIHPDSKIETAEQLRKLMNTICEIGVVLDAPVKLWSGTKDGFDEVLDS